jgi:hypothetical protein
MISNLVLNSSNKKGTAAMRFMVMIRSSQATEAGVLPSEEELYAMTQFNEELVKANVMIAGDGLHPSSNGARIKMTGDQRVVVDGPFAEAKELIAGYWIWEVASKQEAIEWALRCPNPTGYESEIEIRQIFESDDFGEAFTPELRAQEERQRAQLAANQQQH